MSALLYEDQSKYGEILLCRCGDPPMIDQDKSGKWSCYCFGCYEPNPEHKRNQFDTKDEAICHWNLYRAKREKQYMENGKRLTLTNPKI